MTAGEKMRRVGLARALSKLGYCSRAQGFELIRSARVRLNGAVARNPETPVRLGSDRIEVDGNPVGAAVLVYLMMNKPRGVVTTASDEKGRETVYGYLEKGLPWVGPVGRLDKASEGLLLLTNDSEWAGKVLAPETHLEKTYHVQIGARAEEALLESIVRGVRTETGGLLSVKRARSLRGGEKNTWVEVVLDEGKNRHIRRIFEGLGIEVLRLVRVAIGDVALGQLPKGGMRALAREEKSALDGGLKAGSARKSGPRAGRVARAPRTGVSPS